MAITFGSFGDIIAAVQVACKLVEILSAQRGAKREFRDLIVDLTLFHGLLDQLLSFWQSREQCALLDSLFGILHPVICDAKGEIDACLEKIIAKYGRNLTSKQRCNPRDVGKMLQWHVLERDGITKLQEKLRKSKEVIVMVQGQANAIASERTRALVDERMDALVDAEMESMAKLDERLQHLEEDVEKQTEILHHISDGIGSISLAITPIYETTSNAAAILAKIEAELLAQRTVHCTLDPYMENSALVEDALGWTFRIPLELIVSWNTLHSILLDRFANRPGYHLIKHGRYIMREDLSGMEVHHNRPLNLVLRPGGKVNMCMVYYSREEDAYITICPRCKKSTFCANDTDITCSNPSCGMQIQRVSETIDPSNPSSSLLQAIRASTTPDTDRTTQIEFDDLLPQDLLSPPPEGKEPDDPASVFKRIRYITRWDFRAESRGPLLYRTGEYCWWGSRSVEGIAIRRALIRALDAPLSGELPLYNATLDRAVFLSIMFVGTSVERSRPVLVIFSMRERYRRLAWKCVREIDWVKAERSIVFITSASRMFYGGIWEYVERKRKRA
ncbi:hypothetical protein BU26DRAFT_554599 [Trematosphaeria pertusa]|uniref:Ubiquitin-like domain-containing protein n=1 Tax=Trematosphaeria pertusa TaxID=390896 RepID=A0A6A6I2H0_9PLEO|nr:uncharacterized protein BU26DRAFT_554599 [Trematosphaeria pertusa]KAF2243770.1 hypothetical protein BU26DRAFT_554599 [Trematosphaeria pertusa]